MNKRDKLIKSNLETLRVVVKVYLDSSDYIKLAVLG